MGYDAEAEAVRKPSKHRSGLWSRGLFAWQDVFFVAACCCRGAPQSPQCPRQCAVAASISEPVLRGCGSFGLHLSLRGGGKGGCKAKHLSGKGKGRHVMVTKHAFPGLRQGAEHAVATGQNKSLVVTGVKRAAGAYRAEDPMDSDSFSS